MAMNLTNPQDEKSISRGSSTSAESVGYPMEDRVLHASSSLLMMSETPEERRTRHKSLFYVSNYVRFQF